MMCKWVEDMMKLLLRYKLMALFLILLHGIIANADPQCASSYEDIAWMDHNGLLKYDKEEVISDNCQPCNKSVNSNVHPSLKSVTNIVCYTADNDSLTPDDICDWYQAESETEEQKIIPKKFPYISGLKVLSLTKHKIEKWLHIDKVFEELTELEYLYLENNHITGWELSGTSEDFTPPNLTHLKVLSLAYNPIETLNNYSFLWLQNSSIEFLNLRGCSMLEIEDRGVLSPLINRLLSIDLSYTMIRPELLRILLFSLKLQEGNSENGLKALGLAHNGFTTIPTRALEQVSYSLQKLSLQGNFFSNCGSKKINRCFLPFMKSLTEINLRNSGVLDFPCRLLSNNTPNLERVYLDENPLADLACSKGVNISFLSLRSLKSDGLGFQLCNSKSECVFPDLIYLDLSHTKISSLDFTNLTNLEHLSLCNTGVQNMDVLQPLMNLRVLDMGFNKLSSGFKFPELRHLKKLHMQSCAIEKISNDSFENLRSLHTLNMSQNFIQEVNEHHFSKLENMTKLILQENRIRSWKTSILSHQKKKKLFDLQSNWLDDITNAMIEDMITSKVVDLSFNPFSCRICRVGRFFQRYNKSEVDNDLQVIEDRFNFTLRNWDKKTAYMCTTVDNEQRPLSEWEPMSFCESTSATTENSTTQQQPTTYFPTTKLPTTKVSTTKVPTTNVPTTIVPTTNVPTTKVTTTTDTTATDQYMSATEENPPETDYTFIYVICVPIICTLTGTAVCYWKRLNIRMYAHTFKKKVIFTTYKDKIDKNKSYQYDVFLSYSDKDRNWILEQCIPNIEQQSNIKVCLHERDFQAGVPVLENIMACMDKSRCVLLMLSEAFLRSHWCQFELSLAQHRLLDMQHDRLILVLLEHIPRDKCSKTLRYLMLTKTYLQWPVKDKEEDRRLFWCQLKKAIGSTHDAKNISLP